MANTQQASFTGGEISPNLYNRVDLARWFNSLKMCRNFITMPYGGVKNRSGYRFVVEAKDSTRKVRVIEFTPKAQQGYAIEFGHLYLRVTKNGAPLYTPYASLPLYSAAAVYAKNSVLKSGSLPYRSLQDNNLSHTPISSPTWWEPLTVYSPGGIASVLVDLITPYTETELFALRTTQSVDVMTITHPTHQNMNLNHYSDVSWSIVPVPNESGPWLELNLETSKTVSVNKVVGTATLRTTGFTLNDAEHKGRLIYIEQRGYGKPWEVQKAITAGLIRRSDGKYYQALNSATTGTLRPVHTKDSWFDGETGVEWLYLHAGFGIARIDTVLTPNTASVTILSRFPDELSATGTGYGAAVNIAAGTIAADLSGFLVITLAAPHGITTLGACRLTNFGVSGSANITGFVNTSGVADPNSIRLDIPYDDWANNGAPTGNIGAQFDTIEPSATAGVNSDRWKFGAWGGDQGWPSHVFYYQGRRGYAASGAQPNVVWLTRTNAFNDFSTSTPLIDTDALTFPLNSGKLDSIQGTLIMDKLVMLTEGAEWALGTGRDDVATPGNSIPKAQGYRGSDPIQPLIVGDAGMFVQAKGTIVRDIDFDVAKDKYSGTDLTVFADHLFEGRTVVSWTYQQHPNSNIWIVLDNGALLGLTYMREQQVLGWHRHDSGDDFFESVCCVGEQGEDAVYAVVRRLINGTYKRYIERLDTRLITNTKYAFFVDSGKTYDGTTHRNVISDGDDFTTCTLTLTGGTNWNETEQLNLFASQALFQGTSDVGDAIHYENLGDGLFYRLTIEQFVDNHNVKVRANQTLPAALRGTARLDWGLARNTFYLPHLIGREVSVFADGNSLGRYTVDNTGHIVLGTPGVVVSAGLPITADLQTLSVTIQNTEPMLNKKKLIPNVTAQVLESRGLKAGRDFTHLRAAKERTPFDAFDTPAKLQDGVVIIPIDTSWGTDGSICIRQDEPLPLTITALLPEVVLGSL
jgi:hypothetical protein